MFLVDIGYGHRDFVSLPCDFAFAPLTGLLDGLGYRKKRCSQGGAYGLISTKSIPSGNGDRVAYDSSAISPSASTTAPIPTLRRSTVAAAGQHRSTRQAAAFAGPLIEGPPLDDASALPDFNSCVRDGAMPVLATGRFRPPDGLDYQAPAAKVAFHSSR